MHRRNFLLASTGLLVVPSVALAQSNNPMPSELRQALERDPTSPVLGNPDGDVTLTEFFDYNCPFCREMVDPIHRLISSDPNLRVVFREWPVFGSDSEDVARISLASLSQGRYWQVHKALFSIRGKVTAAAARRAASEAGIDLTRLDQDIHSERVEHHITNSFLLAEHMGLMGTPTFIAGEEGAFGKYGLDDLKALVRRARETMKPS